MFRTIIVRAAATTRQSRDYIFIMLLKKPKLNSGLPLGARGVHPLKYH